MSLFDEQAIDRAIVRIAHEIVERNENCNNIILVGIKTRGVPMAERISECIFNKIDSSKKITVGSLDITSFRDDVEKEKNI